MSERLLVRLAVRALVAWWLLAGSTVRAYPSAVVFAPSGEVKSLGELSLYGYVSFVASSHAGLGAGWLGVEVGVMPRVSYGQSGFELGGLELGVDLFLSDLAGTPDEYAKPVLNGKLQLLVERGYVPSIAVGVLGVSPYRFARSLNLIYGSVTKTVEIRGRSYGRVTLGLGGVANDFAGDPYRARAPAFRATWPFDRDSHLALLCGYESPAWGPLSFGIDHVGGVSEVGSTNLVVALALRKEVTLAVGGWFGDDPDAFTAGLFAYLYLNTDLKSLAKKRNRPVN